MYVSDNCSVIADTFSSVKSALDKLLRRKIMCLMQDTRRKYLRNLTHVASKNMSHTDWCQLQFSHINYRLSSEGQGLV